MKKKYTVLNEKKYGDKFAKVYGNARPIEEGVPLLDISEKSIKQIYYFRWNVFYKHIRHTPDGYVITEFLPEVPWAGKYNTISCPAGHHLYEGRWMHKKDYLEEYAKFWFTEGAAPRLYSFWAADAVWALCRVTGNFELAGSLYEALKENCCCWEEEKQQMNGLFYQVDDRDGMEYSAGGSGLRPTINSYMYGDMCALSHIAEYLGQKEESLFYAEKALELKERIDMFLWDEEACFYKTVKEDSGEKATVREEIGYIPWYFNLPNEDKSEAWKFLNDEHYFYAPYGPTTTERNYADFMKQYDHECLWNGPSWPFATSQTLTAMGNLLCNYQQKVIKKSDYFRLLKQYAEEHYLTEEGKTVPFIDENLDPFTGEWLARKILKDTNKEGDVEERGRDYNHSTFCDLVISGLAGIRSRRDEICEINPLFTENDLDYMCADGILYHGHYICVLWDKNGSRYGQGCGFRVYCDGEAVYRADTPKKIEFKLNGRQ